MGGAKLKRVIGLCLIITGMLIGTYHFVEWKTGRSAVEEMTKEEITHYKFEVNQLASNNHSESIVKEQKPSSEVKYKQGEKVALLVVPKIGLKYSVYWGNDQQVLKKGVGMYISKLTTAPDGGGHTVLSGHRDTVFYRMDELKDNELLKLEYADFTYTYKITKIWITDPQDQTVIVKKERPTLTITTCYPFNYIGNAPKRYIIQADLLYKQDSSVIANEKMLLRKTGLE
jgi:sortase A